MNTAKHSNLLFLIIVLFAICASVFLSLLYVYKVEIGIIPNIAISQLMILVPGMVFYLIYTKHGDFVLFKRIKISSVILFVIFTELIIPLATVANIFSQFFVENEVVSMSGDIMEMPFIVMFLIIGILGPLCEEFVFRGVIFKGLLQYSGRPLAAAVLSAVFFGLMHMNLNQALYAVLLGTIFALIDYVFDSLYPSVVCHCVVNAQNVVMLYVMQKMLGFAGSDMTDEMDLIYNQAEGKILLMIALVFMIVVAAVTTVLAAFLLYGICKIENRTDRLKGFISKPDSPQQLLYLSGVVAMAVCGFMIFLLDPVTTLIKQFFSLYK